MLANYIFTCFSQTGIKNLGENMNNITFTAGLRSNGIVSPEIERDFARQTLNMPNGTMHLYKGENKRGDKMLYAALSPKGTGDERVIVELDPFEKDRPDSEKLGVLKLCYKLLQRDKEYYEDLDKKFKSAKLEYLA